MSTAAPRLRDFTSELLAHQKSISFVRYLSCLHEAGWRAPSVAGRIFQMRWPADPHRSVVERAAVPPGVSSDATWAGPLAAIRPLLDGFLEFVRGASLLGTIPGLRQVPTNVSVPAQTTGGAFSWVGQNHIKPITKFDFATVTLDGIRKASGIVVVSRELIALLQPGSEVALRDTLAAGVAAFVDAAFVDRNSVGVADTSPASITSGLSVLAPSGGTGQSLVADVDKLLGSFFASNADVAFAALLMSPAIAAMLASASRSQTLRIDGGFYCGVPVITSTNVLDQVIALDAQQILVADEGLVLDESGETILQMDSAPTDPAVAATIAYSTWQNNTIALRAERFINWKRARTTAVAVLAPTSGYTPGT